MTYLEAIQTCRKLFPPGCKLTRTKNARKCLVLGPDGMPVGDGKSWLDALRSAGTFYIAKNQMRDVEARKLQERFNEFATETGWDVEKLNDTQLMYFDVWMACKEKNEPTPPPPVIEEAKPLVSLK